MANAVSFDVVGAPAGQGSKRLIGRRMVESSAKTRPWRDAVRASTVAETGGRTQFPVGPVYVSIVVYVPRPKSHYGSGRNALRVKDNAPATPHGRPDVDKIARACLDAMTDAGVWHDDSQVADLHVRKQWAQDNNRAPGANITASAL